MLDEIGSRLDIFSHNVWLAYPSCRSAFDVAPQLTLSWVLRLLLDDAHLNSRQQQQQQQEQGPGEQQQPNPSIAAAAALLPGRGGWLQHSQSLLLQTLLPPSHSLFLETLLPHSHSLLLQTLLPPSLMMGCFLAS